MCVCVDGRRYIDNREVVKLKRKRGISPYIYAINENRFTGTRDDHGDGRTEISESSSVELERVHKIEDIYI